MTKCDDRQKDALDMRPRAEALARESVARETGAPAGLSPEELQRTLHELRVHHIELELQKEELRRAQEEIDAARARYYDLYDLAPVGYCTLSEQGLILEANLTLATLLGLARGALVQQAISRFIFKEDQDISYLHRKQLFETGEPQECELRLVRPDGAPFWAQMKGTAARAEDGAPVCRVIISDITERKRAVEALRESAGANLVQAELLRNAPVIAAFHDLNHNIVWANRAYEEATGLSQNEIVGRKCYAVWRLAEPCRGCPVAMAIDSGVTSEAELTPRNQDHWPESQGYWLSRAAPVRDENGKVIGAIEMAFDIGDRKRAEEALRESEERFRITLESIGDAVISTDLEGRVALMNPVAEALTGWSAAEARGRPHDEVFRIVNEQTRATVESPVARVLHEGQIVGLANHTLLIDRQGTERPIADSGAPIRDEQGRISGVVLVFRDQTEERRHLAALRAERENLRAIVDGTPAAVFIVDEAEVVVTANPEAERLFGLTGHEFDGTQRCGDLANCVHCHDDPRGCGFGPFCPSCEVNDALKQALGGHAIRNREVSQEVQHNGGSATRFFVLGAAPVTTSTGRGAALVLQDITALREALAERERLSASLAQSDRLATMGTLAAGIAHEINNPLSYVLYNVESAAEELPRLADDVRRCHDALFRHLGLEEAARVLGERSDAGLPAAMDDVVVGLRDAASGANRIKVIARGLGTFSRVDRDEVMPVQLQPVIEQALNMAFHQIKYRARVVKDYDSIPPVLAADGKLAQVFLNLFINAAHAIDEGHVEENEIRVRTWVEGEAVLAEVSDTGKGIAPEHHDRIFQPFFTTKEVGGGSGLGLSIVRNIVTGFGGEISFSSEPGKGTRFLIRLPRLSRDWQTREASPPDDAPRRSTTRARILVVDDEQAIRATIAKMFGRDHEVVTAASGEEARAILEQDRRFDLILCDLMMPQVSGMELHAWLADRDAELATQVVFITGGAFTPGASEYLARVGNLRVEKPFDTVAFKKLTDELILAARASRGREI